MFIALINFSYCWTLWTNRNFSDNHFVDLAVCLIYTRVFFCCFAWLCSCDQEKWLKRSIVSFFELKLNYSSMSEAQWLASGERGCPSVIRLSGSWRQWPLSFKLIVNSWRLQSFKDIKSHFACGELNLHRNSVNCQNILARIVIHSLSFNQWFTLN